MSTFNEIFAAEEKKGNIKKQATVGRTLAEEKAKERGHTAPAEKVHPSDDADIRKARKERRKTAKEELREKAVRERKLGDENKQRRIAKQKVWEETRRIQNEELAEQKRHDDAVEGVVGGLAIVQTLAASGVPATFRGITDVEHLHENRVNMRGKKQANAEKVSECIETLALGVQKGLISPYQIAVRLSAVPMNFLNCFDTFLDENLPEEDSLRIKNWLTSQRSHVSTGKDTFVAAQKSFVPVDPATLSADDDEDDEEGEEAEEGEEGGSDDEAEVEGATDEKQEKQEERTEKKVAKRKKGDETKQARQAAWEATNKVNKAEQAEAKRHEDAVEGVVGALAILQTLAASGVPATFRGVTDVEYLHENRINMRGKKQAHAEQVCDGIETLALRVQKGVISPYQIAARLSAVPMNFLNSFDAFLDENLPAEESKRIKNWLTSQRSHIGTGKDAFLTAQKSFVPVDPATLPSEDDGEGEEAEEGEEGGSDDDVMGDDDEASSEEPPAKKRRLK